MTQLQDIERRWGDAIRARLPGGWAEFLMFWFKQAWAALFGLLMLAAIIVTSRIWQPDWPLARYDFLVIYAVTIQVVFLWTRLETFAEAKVIFLFHLTGTAMEMFKVQAGSWAYPEAALLKVYGVPLFSGFMYASVGSYIARVIRYFDMTFAPYPPYGWSVALAVAIYCNFFLHHFIWDARYALMALTVVMFARTRIWFWIADRRYWMPLPLAALLSAFFIWLAENIGQATRTWAYAGQSHLDMVSIHKLGSWYLLLFVSFATVTLVFRDALKREAVTPPARDTSASPGTAPRTEAG